MARPKQYASAAQRQAAYKARARGDETPSGGDETHGICDETPNNVTQVTNPGDETPNRTPPGFVAFRHQDHVPLALFDGVGRGSARQYQGAGYVMVARHDGPHLGELGIVTAPDWLARLTQRCIHGYHGWACHAC